jgi:hypothetical protein
MKGEILKDYLYFYWNFHGHGGAKAAMAMLRRCDLRHIAKQNTDIELDDPDADPEDEPWTTGSDGCVKLPADDPRIPLLVAELRKAGIESKPNHYRTWTTKDLEGLSWLAYSGYSTAVEAGGCKGQQWDFHAACPSCGTGAIPVPPIIARLEKMPKQGVTLSVPHGLLIVRKTIATALSKAKLTGFTLELVRTPSRDRPDDRFRWVRITSKWPAPSPRPTCRVRPACPDCRGLAFYRPFDEPSEVHCEALPAHACDINEWQGTVDPADYKDAANRLTGGSRLIILSQRAYRAIRAAGVKSLRCEPVIIAERS